MGATDLKGTRKEEGDGGEGRGIAKIPPSSCRLYSKCTEPKVDLRRFAKTARRKGNNCVSNNTIIRGL